MSRVTDKTQQFSLPGEGRAGHCHFGRESCRCSGGAAGSGPGLDPVGELEQGLLAVDDEQVGDVGLQLVMLFRRRVPS